MAKRLDQYDIEEIRRAILDAIHSGMSLRETAKTLAEQYKVDISRIYFYTKDLRPGRQERADKGKRTALSDDQYNVLAKISLDLDMAATTIARKARLNGMDFNEATFRRYLRDDRISRKDTRRDLTPYRHWEAKYSNHVHQIDTTVAQQFYLDDDGSIGYEKAWSVNKNRPGNQKPRLTLAQLVDDKSRVKYAEFILGNNTLAWMHFLYNAWKVKGEQFPFFGLPEMIYSDNDSVIKSTKFVYAMNHLGIKIQTHTPGNSRAKGKVESGFKMLQEFEKITKFYKFKSLDEANRYLQNELLHYNNNAHSTTGQKPFERWLGNLNGKPRMVPDRDLFETLCLTFGQAVIDNDLTVKILGKTFQLPFAKPFINYIKCRVDIAWHPENDQRIWVIINNKDYEVEYMPVKTHEAGEFRAVKTPDYMKKREEIEQTDISGFDLMKQETEFPTWAMPDGQSFQSGETHAIDPMVTKFIAIGMLQEEDLFSRPITAEQDRIIDELFAGSAEIERSKVENFIQQYKTAVIRGDVDGLFSPISGNATIRDNSEGTR